MLTNMKIGTRLILAFGLMLVLLMVIGLVSMTMIKTLSGNVTTLATDRMPKVERAYDIIGNVNISARALRNIVIDADKGTQAAELKRIVEARAHIDSVIVILQTDIRSEKGRQILQDMVAAHSKYSPVLDQYIDHVKSGRVEEAKKMLLTTLRDVQRNYFSSIEKLVAFQSDLAKTTAKEAADKASRSVVLIVVLLLGAIAISFVSGILLVRSITGPVNKTVQLAETMAKGDLTVQIEVNQKDEIGRMAISMNATVAQLRTMIGEIIGGIPELFSSSTELAAVSKQLSSSALGTAHKSGTVATAAEEMSTNIQSVSAAMEQSSNNARMVATATEEMTATVNEIGRNAEKAREVSESAVRQSQETSDKVAALGESARKVGKVTETITEISEQTNLLALNATIEAARAGEAGKGFAVVANEIKELARQTAAATVQIKNQIDEMQDTTTSTIGDIDKITKVIADINNVINGIATAVVEQSAAINEIAGNISQASQGIGEVNENVAQSSVVITEITENITEINNEANQVGAGSSQVEMRAQGLSELASKLETLMKRFKV